MSQEISSQLDELQAYWPAIYLVKLEVFGARGVSNFPQSLANINALVFPTNRDVRVEAVTRD